MAEPTFFATPALFRRWLAAHHATARELWVGFHKTRTGTPSLTWPESVDEALCYGWIDGLRKSLGDDAYMIRFTPRKATSHWSLVNVAKMATLEAEGRMTEAGRAAFALRREANTGRAGHERAAPAELPEAWARELAADAEAAAFFAAQAPSYQRIAKHVVMKGKQEATRRRRFEELLRCCREGRKLRELDAKQVAPGKTGKAETAPAPAKNAAAPAKKKAAVGKTTATPAKKKAAVGKTTATPAKKKTPAPAKNARARRGAATRA